MKNTASTLKQELLNYNHNSLNNKNLIKSLFNEIEDFIKSDLDNSELLRTQLLILLYGANLYNNQFGFNHVLSNFLNNCIHNIYKDVDLERFSLTFKNELNQTLLTCAHFDNLFSKNIRVYISNRPWICANSYNFDQFKQLSKNQTKTEQAPILKRDNSDCFISAQSKDGGFVLSRLDEYSKEFLKYSLKTNSNILNIGSGYGILERLALQLGSKAKMYCNDVCEDHLKIIKTLTPANYQNSVNFVPGFFPNDLNLPNNYFSIIGIFRVLHFMKPENLIQAIIKANNLLEDGGYLILSAETSYLGNWIKFIPIFEKNVLNKDLWPGYIEDTSEYETEGYKNKLPKSMHFLDVDTITRVLNEHGFEVIKCSTFDRSNTFPDALKLDGRESVGAVAKKVKNI